MAVRTCTLKRDCVFCCLGFHRIKACKVKTWCKCSGKHLPLLCNKPTEVVREDSVGQTVDRSLQVHSNVNKNQSLKLKQTVHQTKILFDSGSDRSYISSDCASNLDLKVVGKEKVTEALFGQEKPNQPKLRNEYRLQLLSQNCEIEELIVTESPMIWSLEMTMNSVRYV